MSLNDNQYAGGNDCGNSTHSTGIPCDSKADAARLSIDKRMDDIETTIASLEAERLSLRFERNRYSPISKLPSELLTGVFELVICLPSIKPPDIIYDWIRPKHLAYEEAEYLLEICWRDLRQILHVCSAWRVIAFGCPRLWSRIIGAHRRSMESAIEEMLANAKLSPLSLRLSSLDQGPGQKSLIPALEKALDLPRIEELHVKLDIPDLRVVFRSIRGSNASKLQSLYIHNTGFGLHFNSHTELFCIPKEFLAMPMPRLYNLNLSHCRLDWDALNTAIHAEPSRLLWLKLVDVSKPTREQFYHLLSATPLLEYLHVDDALPSPPEDVLCLDPELVSGISLLDLKDCAIISSLPACVDFQLRVLYPSTSAYTSFSLSCPVESRPQHGDATLVATLLGLCGMCLERGSRRHVSLVLHGPGVEPQEDPHIAYGIVLQDHPSVGDATSEPAKKGDLVPSLYIRFVGPGECGYWHRLAVLMLSVKGLKQLRVRMLPNSINKRQWLSFFSRHTEVEHLHIDFSSTAPPSRLLRALATLITDFTPIIPPTNTYWSSAPSQELGLEEHSVSSEATTSNLCLPALTKLSVRRQSRSESGSSSSGSQKVIQKLSDCLSVRRNHNLPIAELKLRNFNALDNEYATLREVALAYDYESESDED